MRGKHLTSTVGLKISKKKKTSVKVQCIRVKNIKYLFEKRPEDLYIHRSIYNIINNKRDTVYFPLILESVTLRHNLII